jgi:type I restriction enzyme S subunit
MKLFNHKLGDGLHIKHGFAFLSKFFSEKGKYIILTPGNFYEAGGFKSRPEKDRFYTGIFPHEYILKKGDLIIAMTEQGPGLLGSPAFIPENDTYLHNQRLGLIDEIDADIFEKRYLFHLFNSRLVRSQIYGSATGTKVKHTSPRRVYKVKVSVPCIDNQARISNIDDNYYELIKINRRRIQLLEEAVRLLFREWFVYFRFPGHEKVKLTDYKGVHIPEGWEYLPITKIKIFKKTSVGVPVFIDTRQYYQTSEIDGTNLIGSGEEVDYENKPSRASVKPKMNSVYFARMKDTNKVLYFNNANSDMLEKILLSTGMAGFTTDKKFLAFLFGLLTSYEFVQNKNNYATGATQVSLSDSGLKKIKVLFPTLNLIELYSEIVNPFLEICSNLRKQNYILSQARDLLLPRLMSGKIDVSKIDINVVQEA